MVSIDISTNPRYWSQAYQLSPRPGAPPCRFFPGINRDKRMRFHWKIFRNGDFCRCVNPPMIKKNRLAGRCPKQTSTFQWETKIELAGLFQLFRSRGVVTIMGSMSSHYRWEGLFIGFLMMGVKKNMSFGDGTYRSFAWPPWYRLGWAWIDFCVVEPITWDVCWAILPHLRKYAYISDAQVEEWIGNIVRGYKIRWFSFLWYWEPSVPWAIFFSA